LIGGAHRVKLISMGTLPIVRKARPLDAEAVARVYVESWRETYPLVLPARALSAMTIEGQSARWRNAIALAVREAVLVAEDEKGRILGMTSMGRARDTGVGYDAEIYTLYVDPLMTGRGIGRLLLAGAFAALNEHGHTRCVIWAHAGNPARFFYEAMGGKLIAERTTSMMGVKVPEVAFGWPRLALAERKRKSEIGTQKP
jgi:GNAT superfamily N-acetyltransferase